MSDLKWLKEDKQTAEVNGGRLCARLYSDGAVRPCMVHAALKRAHAYIDEQDALLLQANDVLECYFECGDSDETYNNDDVIKMHEKIEAFRNYDNPPKMG